MREGERRNTEKAGFEAKRSVHVRKRIAAFALAATMTAGGTLAATAGPASAQSFFRTCKQRHGILVRVDNVVVACLLPGNHLLRPGTTIRL